MPRLCSRTGCGAPAAAAFAFDALSRLVWLDPPAGGTGAAGWLCARHADTLTPPRGWQLQDRRVPAPRLWADRPSVPPAHLRQPPARPRPASPAVATDLTLPFEPSSEAPVEAAGYDLDRLLTARTPLLARAFAPVRRR